MRASGTRIEGRVWLDGVYQGTYELYPIRDPRRLHEDPFFLVLLDDTPHVARGKQPHGSDYEVVFSLESLDAAIARLRRDLDAESAGPITISIPIDSALWDPPPGPGPRSVSPTGSARRQPRRP